MTTNYAKGAVFERQVKKKLEAAGWFVVRMAGSHSVADLVAFDTLPTFRNPNALIQCKTDGRIGPKEWNALVETAKLIGAIPYLAKRVKRKLTIVQLAGSKTVRRQSKTWDASWMLTISGRVASTGESPTDGGSA